MKQLRTAFTLVALATWTTLAGCGALQQTAADGVEAGFQTLVDLWITELANDVAASLLGTDDGSGDPSGDVPDDGDGGGDADPDDGGADGDTDPGGDPPMDDPLARGQALVADNCAACHGADGASGFAPDIQNASADDIGMTIDGSGGHTPIELTADEVADIVAFLESQ